MPGKITSQAQLGMIYAAASGKKTKSDLTPYEAKKMLKDNPVKKRSLPQYAPKKK